ncbi:MAG: CRTAC1 family protein [Acidobacteria bacterium]|nr:MAG: CRTAC1 family protein [Acidobacteriota bacterium]
MRCMPSIGALLVLLLSSAAGRAQTGPPWFTEITDQVGLTGVEAFRIAVGDLDGDGYPDLLIHTEPDHAAGDVLNKQYLYLSEPVDPQGDPAARIFVDHTAGSGLRANRQGTPDGRHSDAAIFADVDNDGDLDVFTNVYLHRSYDLDLGTNDLLLNNGDATFVLSPNSTFHLEPNWNTPAATFLDYDNDGNVDLFIGTWYKPDSTMNIDHLYRGGGDGSFTDVTAGTGIDLEPTCVYAVSAFDWDNDGDMDLFAPPYSRTVFWSLPRHWRNNGDGTFTQVQDQTNYDEYRGILGQKVSFGTMPRDFDNDGQIDFFEIMTHGEGDGASGVHSTPVRNGAGVFSWDFWRLAGRDAEDPDLTHHGDHFASWFDFDGDGLVDIVFTESGYSNPRLYLAKQNPDHTFTFVTPGSGLDVINTEGVEPGYVTPADFDRDGDEDLFVTAGNVVRLFRNDAGNANAWLAVELEGVGGPGHANRSAIGARIEVTAGGVTQVQEVTAGNGHEGPMRPLVRIFGLGAATVVDSLRIRWPDAAHTVQELTAVPVNRYLHVREPCDLPADPSGLTVERAGDDLLLAWDDPGAPVTFNVYREATPDPSGWGAPHETGVTDEDPATPGIQHTDAGAAADGATWFYLVTAVDACGESALR